jgi:endonuclease YncB( thermonuclease family)
MAEGRIEVAVDGVPDNGNEYDDDRYLEADQKLREALVGFWNAGARADNIEETLQGGLEDAVSG